MSHGTNTPVFKYPLTACHGSETFSRCARDQRAFPEEPLQCFAVGARAVRFSPLWGVIACAIKLEDGGPIFFRQERWGQEKRPIRVYKFRTMIPNADRTMRAAEDDPRITHVGRILRTTALDEMPQLLNIWKGEMSFVGRRALPINERQVRERRADLRL
jgi:lipopolysaccharide/colanic/teichoic acid biosynthesis glycosyltransferase